MKIAVLYICTGKYHIFWNSFYESAQRFFLSEHDKDYFLFSDSKFIDYLHNEKVNVIFQEKLGWPFDTLKRFEIFLKVEKQLASYDYIFFLNANMLFLDYVNEDILPETHEYGLLGVQHPFFTWVTDPKDFPYERNNKSLASIHKKQGSIYYMGGFNGGASQEYLKLIRILDKNINSDLIKNIIAKWHDESHLNKYYLNKSVKTLSPVYGCPEGMEDKFPNPKIIILDKIKYGGHDFLRESQDSIPKENDKEPKILQKFLNVFKQST